MTTLGNPESLLPTVGAADLADRPVPPRRWLVLDLIPAGQVAMLNGDGGAGKSLLGLQVAAATALGRPWLGYDIDAAPALVVAAEDDLDELHRRLLGVAAHYAIGLGELRRLTLAPMAGLNALLTVPPPKGGPLMTTPLYDELDRAMSRTAARLLVLDTLADLHAGSEIDRSHARTFIGLLRHLAISHAATVLVLAHPSLAGLASGSGLSGSTGWNASVRSRLYLDRPKDTDADPTLRVLRTIKSNYGAAGGSIPLRWRSGVFVRDGQPGTLDALVARSKADCTFMALLDAFEGDGRVVSDRAGRNYTPAQFAGDPRAERITKRGFEECMARLFAEGRIRVVDDGPASRRRNRIVRRSGADG